MAEPTLYVRNKPNPLARMRVFCFPHAGGGASLFYSWARVFPQTIDLCPVQLPGRENRIRETPKTSLAGVAGELTSELAPLFDLPFAIVGYSLGSLLSFELTRQLRRNGQSLPIHLLVGAARAPHCPNPNPPIHQLSEPEFLQALAGRYEGMRAEVLQNAELMQMCLPSLRGDFTMLETYRHEQEPPLALPISASGGLLDRATKQPEVAAWEQQTTAAFKLRMFPGGHFFVNENRDLYLQSLLQDLMPYVS